MNKTTTVKRGRGRPERTVSFPKGRAFTLKAIESRFRNLGNPISKVTLHAKLEKLITSRKAKIVGRKTEGRGRPWTVYLVA